MVQITQTEEEIKIIIELNRVTTQKPDIVLLPRYFKFNCPPVFFERHLVNEIDEESSLCRLFKNEARIVLIKRNKGIWPELFQNLSREELKQKRLEITDRIIQRNKEHDEQAVLDYERKKRAEIEKEVRRETAMRERYKQFQEAACREAFAGGIIQKETNDSDQNASQVKSTTTTTAINVKKAPAPRRALAAVRSSGKISFGFSNYDLRTPKRESQQGKFNPFFQQCNLQQNNAEVPSTSSSPSADGEMEATN